MNLSLREFLIWKIIIISVLIVLSTEILSFFSAINRSSIKILWGVSLVIFLISIFYFYKKKIILFKNLKKKELSELSWQTGESNTDTDFSNLSKECCFIAFKNINKIKELSLEINIPDLKIKFKYKKKIINKKIELKSTKSINSKIPGSMNKNTRQNLIIKKNFS